MILPRSSAIIVYYSLDVDTFNGPVVSSTPTKRLQLARWKPDAWQHFCKNMYCCTRAIIYYDIYITLSPNVGVIRHLA